jgi:hypothetical protein
MMSHELGLPQSPALQPEQGAESSKYQHLVEAGLNQAEDQHGFDLQTSIISNHLELSGGESLEQYQSEVQAIAVSMAEDAGLQANFFESPAKTVLLLSIADSWATNERRAAANSDHDTSIADERAMLGDVMLMLAGEQSSVVTDLVERSDPLANRYMETSITNPIEEERQDFLDSLNDPERALKVTAALAMTGPGSFLEKQRSLLGVTAENQKPLTVKVLKIGSAWGLINAGTLTKPDYPDSAEYDGINEKSTAEQTKIREQAKLAQDIYQENQNAAKPYEAADKEYTERFGEQLGPLPLAYVNKKKDGTNELVLRAEEADMLLNYFVNQQPIQKGVRLAAADIERSLAIARHEYGHTQKSLSIGQHNQLGLVVEERKAEYVSGDKQGYQDVKNYLQDLTMATGIDVLGVLDAALKQTDPLATLVASSANKIGLRDTLMMMVAKPLPYEKNPEQAKKFAGLDGIHKKSDVSSLDSLIRQTVERRGEAELARNIDNWVKRLLKAGHKPEWISESLVHYREANGLAYSGKFIEQAVKDLAPQT